MEPRSVTATPDAGHGRDQGLDLDAERVRGQERDRLDRSASTKQRSGCSPRTSAGASAPRAASFPEEVLTALAAWRSKRPVRWVASRSEDGATTAQGHGSVIELELAADRDGKLRGLRGRVDPRRRRVRRLGHRTARRSSSATWSRPTCCRRWRSKPSSSTRTPCPRGFIRGGGRPLGNYGNGARDGQAGASARPGPG